MTPRQIATEILKRCKYDTRDEIINDIVSNYNQEIDTSQRHILYRYIEKIDTKCRYCKDKLCNKPFLIKLTENENYLTMALEYVPCKKFAETEAGQRLIQSIAAAKAKIQSL